MNGEFTVFGPTLNWDGPYVTDPDGNELSIVGSTTMGLQEAINAAWLNGANVSVIGAPASRGSGANFICNSPVYLTGSPAISVLHPSTFSIRFNGCTVFFPVGVKNGWIIDSCSGLLVDAEAMSTVTADPGATAVLISPTRSTDFGVQSGASALRFGFLAQGAGATSSIAMHLQSTVADAVGLNALKIGVLGHSGFNVNLQIDDPAVGCGSIDSNLFYGGWDHETNSISMLGLAKNRFLISDSINDAEPTLITPLPASGFTWQNNTLLPTMLFFDTGAADSITYVKLSSGMNPTVVTGVLTLGSNSSGSVYLRSGYQVQIGYTGSPGISYMAA